MNRCFSFIVLCRMLVKSTNYSTGAFFYRTRFYCIFVIYFSRGNFFGNLLNLLHAAYSLVFRKFKYRTCATITRSWSVTALMNKTLKSNVTYGRSHKKLWEQESLLCIWWHQMESRIFEQQFLWYWWIHYKLSSEDWRSNFIVKLWNIKKTDQGKPIQTLVAFSLIVWRVGDGYNS